MSQTPIRHYLDALRVAHAAAWAENAVRVAAYHVLPQGVSCQGDWAGWGDPFYAPTARQQALLDTLQDLIDGGETEASVLALQAALRLRVPEAEVLRSRDNVDADGASGYFFDDVMHALFLLDAQETEQHFYGLVDRLMQPTAPRAGACRPR